MLRFVSWYINCRSEVTDIVKDMLKNPNNVVYVIFDVLPHNVYICLILGAKCKNLCAGVKWTSLIYLFQYSYTQKQTKVLQDSSATTINV